MENKEFLEITLPGHLEGIRPSLILREGKRDS